MRYVFFILITSLFSAGTSYPGMNNWYHPTRLALAGSGGAYSSVTADVVNPASLWTLKQLLDVSFISYPADIQAQSFHLVLPKKSSVTVYGMRHLNYGLFEGRNSDNQKTGTYNASDTWFDWAAAGHSSQWPITWGMSAGLFLSSIQNKQSAAVTLSAGVLIDFVGLDSKVGINLANLGSVIKTYTGQEEPLPTLLEISFSRKLAHLPLVIVIDMVSQTRFEKYVFRFGRNFFTSAWIRIKIRNHYQSI